LRAVAFLLISAAFIGQPAAAGSANNSLLGDVPRPTPYGLKIVRGNDDRRAEPESELPIAGLSLLHYLQAVQNVESDGGAYAADLAEPLEDMGRALQTENKHAEAMQLFDRALHLSRINEGLYSPTQLPLLASMIESELAMGRLQQVDDKQDYRFRMQHRIYEPGDPALTDAIMEYTEWQRQAYLDGFAGPAYRRVVTIYDVHDREIERMEADDPTDPRLLPHLYQRMRAEYLVAEYEGEKEPEFQINITRSADAMFAMSTDLAARRFDYLKEFNYRNGIRTMERIIEVFEAQEHPDPMELARARIALGDWHMWWDAKARALQNYEAAWAILAADAGGPEAADALFATPVELPEEPVFHPGEITSLDERRAHATVLIDVSRTGAAEEIEIVQQEPPDDMGARVVLFNMLRDMRFRPIVREGKAIAASAVVRDYRYEY
jgi:hypothetical protein